MLTKAGIKDIQSLSQKRGRMAAGCFIAEGDKVVTELMQSGRVKTRNIFALPAWIEKNKAILALVPVTVIAERELERISQLVTPQQVLGVFELPEQKLDIAGLNNSTFLILDGINDPGNLGTIIRIADWFGITNIICSKGSADAYSPKVVQATMGSVARVNVFYEDLKEFIPQLTIPVYGAFLEGENIYRSELIRPAAIIMGSESHGISEEIEKLIKLRISIPSFNKSDNKAESLNVAVSTGIICSEFFRA